MSKNLIKDWESMNDQREKEDSYNCFVFCKTHYIVGTETLKTQGEEGLDPVDEEQYKVDEEKRKLEGPSKRRPAPKPDEDFAVPTTLVGTSQEDVSSS